MKISTLRLSWFRGAAEDAELVTNNRSIAVYGDNGAGKSCFVDAIEYILRGGRVEHLAHEYSGRHQEKAILNTHRPTDTAATISLLLTDSSRVDVEISPSGVFELAVEGDARFHELDCGRTVLRQDEVSDFVHSTKGQKYSVLLPLLGLAHLETAAENFRQLGKAILKESGIKEAEVSLRSARATFDQVFADAEPESADAVIAGLCETFVGDEHDHDAHDCIALVSLVLKARLRDASALERQQVALERLGNFDLRRSIENVRSAAASLAEAADAVVREQVAVLKAMVGFLEESTDEEGLRCPACGSEVARSQMVGHVERELSRLEAATDLSDTYRSRVRALILLAKRIVNACESDEISRWASAASDARIPLLISDAAGVTVPEEELSESDLARLEEVLGKAVHAAAAAASFLPPAATDLAQAQEKLTAAASLIAAEGEVARVEAAKELAEEVAGVEAKIREEIRVRSQRVIETISADIQRMWVTLHPGEPIEDVRLHVPGESEKAIDIALKFYGKELASPRLTLSEGYRNSLGLCVFLAMAARYAQGDSPVVLDDVIVSLDRGHRGMVVKLLREEFADRQVLLFTHDRDWFVDLRQQLDPSDWSFRSLLPYSSPSEGIRWSDRTGTLDDARAYLDSRPDTAANEARKTLDIELAMHVERLGISLRYARGSRNDRRTGHEFLQALISQGKKKLRRQVEGGYEAHDDAISALEAADRLLVTWANRGSHTEDVTRSEAEMLIDTCAEALEHLTCADCGKPVSFAETRSGLRQCQCGQLRWK